jgi:hypothetical protein
MEEYDLGNLAIRIETTAKGLCAENASPHELYECLEMICIQILDSEFSNFPAQILEAFLQGYLAATRSMLIPAE